MDRQLQSVAAYRTTAGLDDVRDLLAAVDSALAAEPVDERLLREAVFTYVDAERDAGVPPGHVILALTERVRMAAMVPSADVPFHVRSVILWCVEAYFGHLGGDVFARDRAPALASTEAR